MATNKITEGDVNISAEVDPTVDPVDEGKNRKAGDKVSSFLQSFKDHKKERQPIRQKRKEDARAAMGNAYKKDISKYDSSAYGGRRFSNKDIDHLRSVGYSNKEIAQYSRKLDKNQLAEGIRHNHKRFAGQHYTERLGADAKMTDHDVGRGFNMSDVKYLQSHGFKDADIAAYANKSVKEDGKRHYGKMAKWMDEQGQLDYNFGDWKNASGGGGNGGGGDNGGGDNGGGNGGGGSDDPGNGGDLPNKDPQEFKDGYQGTVQSVADSLNATGGTLTNSGDITAGGDVTFDNSVTNENTLNQFGGDNRSFTYYGAGSGGGGGGGTGDGGSGGGIGSMNSYKDPYLNDTPVSAATMAGFYGPSDSPAAAAKFSTMHSELNKSKQKQYKDSGMDVANNFIKSASKANKIDTNKLNANLAVQPYVDSAKSDLITAQTFGDIWKYRPNEFKMAGGFVKPEAPDFDKMFSNISKEIKE